MSGSSGRTRRDRQSPENEDVAQAQFQRPGPSPQHTTRGPTQHVPLHGQDIQMPDNVFGEFLPIDPMFPDNPPSTYNPTTVPAGLTPQMADMLYQGFLENLGNWAYVSLVGSRRGLAVTDVQSGLYETKDSYRRIGDTYTQGHNGSTHAG